VESSTQKFIYPLKFLDIFGVMSLNLFFKAILVEMFENYIKEPFVSRHLSSLKPSLVVSRNLIYS
jgi:hypothetical protein